MKENNTPTVPPHNAFRTTRAVRKAQRVPEPVPIFNVGDTKAELQTQHARKSNRIVGIVFKTSEVLTQEVNLESVFQEGTGLVLVRASLQPNHLGGCVRFRFSWAGGRFVRCRACTTRYKRLDSERTVAALVRCDWRGRPLCGHKDPKESRGLHKFTGRRRAMP